MKAQSTWSIRFVHRNKPDCGTENKIQNRDGDGDRKKGCPVDSVDSSNWQYGYGWIWTYRSRIGYEDYPLVICYIAIENCHWNSEFSHYKMVIFHRFLYVYQRVYFWSGDGDESLAWLSWKKCHASNLSGEKSVPIFELYPLVPLRKHPKTVATISHKRGKKTGLNIQKITETCRKPTGNSP